MWIDFSANLGYDVSEKGCDNMNEYDRLAAIADKNHGIITTAEALASGATKFMLSKFLRENNYERVYHGIYLAPDAWRDDAYLTQLRCPQAIFSHDSALFFHDLTDREPLQFTVTAKTGYNPTHLTADGVKVYTVKASLYEVGISESVTPFGNTVRAYDVDRTICDIVRSRSTMENQVLHDALKQYAKRKNKNLHRLMEYAALFHVEKYIRDYMGILL